MASLSRGYLSPANRFKWKKVAETLRDNTSAQPACPFQVGDGDVCKGIAKGLKAFFSDQGYGMTTDTKG